MQLTKQDGIDFIESTIKALLNTLPGLGGVASGFSDVLERRNKERLQNVLDDLQEQINNKNNCINSSFIRSEDFVDVCILSLNKICNERTQLKRKAYQNILFYGIFSSSIVAEAMEDQIRLIDQLNSAHIEILRLMYDPINLAKEMGKDGISRNNLFLLLRELLPNWERDYILDHLADLEYMRLIDPISGGSEVMQTKITVEQIAGKLTSRGMALISFIKSN
ncbi:MAG: hypothetical protein J0L56_13740 [Chitinophagales bacterium]|nr:hypothetical protein [Chitinophagales bacterium]